MNIGIFTDTYYPIVNGVATSTLMLERELSKLGHNVYVFTTTNPDIDLKSDAPNVFRLPSMPFVFLPSQRVTIAYSPKLLLNTGKLNLDVVHTQTEFPIGIFGWIVSRFYKIPAVHTYHTMYEDYVHYIANGHLITKGMARRYTRLFCNRARAVIAPTQKTKDFLKSVGVRRSIRIIPSGIDFEPFNKNNYAAEDILELKASLNIKETDKTMIFIGRIAKEKSIDVIIGQLPKIVERIPDIKFVIVGNGPARKSLSLLAEKLGVSDNVVFAGEKPWSEIGKFYQLGGVFISSSTSETQGITYVEAMASGLPVVCKSDKSTEDLIIHKNTGYTFDSGEEIQELIYNIFNNPDEVKTVTENAYKRIESLSSRQFALNMEALYEEVIRFTNALKR